MEEFKITFEPQYIEWSNHWIISDGNDNFICKYLNINKDKFHKIIKRHGEHVNKFKDHYFCNKEDCQKFLNDEELLSYLIMEKLTKN